MALDIIALQSLILERLPVRRRWLIGESPLDFDFSVASNGLHPPVLERFEKVEIWKALLVFGNQCYAEGGGASPWLCVDSLSGAVCGMDLERELPRFALNSTLEQFVKTFECLDPCLQAGVGLPSNLAEQVERIDPTTYPRSQWRLLVEHLIGGVD